MLGLGLSLTTGGVATPAYVVLAKAFVSRVEADGGTVDSFACLKTDMAYLTSNPDAPAGYTAEWSGATVGSSAEFRINLVGGAGYTYTYAVTDTQATEVTGTGVMGGDIQAVTADLSTLVDGTVTLAVYLTGAGGDGNVVTDTANLVGVDADYQAVLDYAATQGYTAPSAAQQTLQNTLVTDLKTAGVWSKLDAFSVYATDGDSNFALIDWKRLSTQTATNSPTFTANSGYRGDAASARIQSGFVPSTDGVNYQLNSASMFKYRYQVRTAGQAQAYEGILKSGFGYALIASSPFTQADNYIHTNGGAIFVSQALGASPAFQLLTRNGNSIATYVDGTLAASGTSAPSSLPDIEIWSLSANNGGAGMFFSDVGISIEGYGADLSAEQADFNTAIQNYISAL